MMEQTFYIRSDVVVDYDHCVIYRMVLPFKDEMSVRDFRMISKMSCFIFKCFSYGSTLFSVCHLLQSVYLCNRSQAQQTLNQFLLLFDSFLTTDLTFSKPNYPAIKWVKTQKLPQVDFINQRFTVPLSITCILTEACDKHCRYCFYGAGGSPNQNNSMEYSLALQIIDEAKNAGVQSITFTGGEPMLYPQIIEVLNYCKQNNIQTILTTRGSKDLAKAQRLTNENLSQATVGLDAITCSIAQKLSQSPDTVTNTVAFIRTLLANKIKIKLLCIVSKWNLHEVPRIIEFAKNLNIKTVVFRECAESFGRNDNSILLDNGDRSKVLQWLDENKSDNLDIHFTKRMIDSNYQITKPITCRMGRHVMTIRYDGNVIMCDTIINDDRLIIGNIKNASLMEIWNSSRMIEFINPPLNQYHDTLCEKCHMFSNCNKNQCAYASLLVNRTIYGPYSNCKGVL